MAVAHPALALPPACPADEPAPVALVVDPASIVPELLSPPAAELAAPLARVAGELLWTGDDLTLSGDWQFGDAGSLMGLDQFHADGRFTGIDGSGFAVVILDTGIDLDHPFFGPDGDGDGVADRIVYNHDFVSGDVNAQDGHGHGSNVSSIIASSDPNWPGVAPGVDIIHLQVLADNGSGTFAGIEHAFQWIVANAETYNIAAVNLSLGDGGNYAQSTMRYGLSDELATLAALDVVVVAAAGNGFYGTAGVQGVSYPAADPNVLAVGAVYAQGYNGWNYGSGAKAYSTAPDRIAPFSQRHSLLTPVFAPGAPITGASATGGLNVMHGTSQAAPHVTGAAVLAQQLAVRELGRRLTVDEFTLLLRDTSLAINDGDDENDNVVNTNEDFARIDMQALAAGILAMNTLSFEAGMSARYADADGTWVTVTLTGPGQGSVVFTPGVAGEAVRIELFDTTDLSTLTITTATQAGSTTVGDLIVSGSLQSLDAAQVDLAGELTFTGGIGTLVLGDVTGGGTITIGRELATSEAAVLRFDRVEDLSIDSAAPLRSITAIDWRDRDGTPDRINAPSLEQLAIRGSRARGVAGDFEADLNLISTHGSATEADRAEVVLGYVQIAGALSDANWQVAGSIGRIDAGRASGWSLAAAGDVRTVRLGGATDARLVVGGSIRSVFAARWFDSSIVADQVAESHLTADSTAGAVQSTNRTMHAGALSDTPVRSIAGATRLSQESLRQEETGPSASGVDNGSAPRESQTEHNPDPAGLASMVQLRRAADIAASPVHAAIAAWSLGRARLEYGPSSAVAHFGETISTLISPATPGQSGPLNFLVAEAGNFQLAVA